MVANVVAPPRTSVRTVVPRAVSEKMRSRPVIGCRAYQRAGPLQARGRLAGGREPVPYFHGNSRLGPVVRWFELPGVPEDRRTHGEDHEIAIPGASGRARSRPGDSAPGPGFPGEAGRRAPALPRHGGRRGGAARRS